MRLAPADFVVVVAAAADAHAHYQEQHLVERVANPPGLPRVLDGGGIVLTDEAKAYMLPMERYVGAAGAQHSHIRRQSNVGYEAEARSV